jgi:hypothetical protein
MKKLTLSIDIDNTIRPEVSAFDKILQEPFEGAVEKVNKLYDAGHQIIFFSAVSWNEYNATLFWLNKWGFKFHRLICSKPPADVYVDDRSVKSLDELLLKITENEKENS